MKIPVRTLPSKYLPGLIPTFPAIMQALVRLKKAYPGLVFTIDAQKIGYIPSYLARSDLMYIYRIEYIIVQAAALTPAEPGREIVRKVDTKPNYGLHYQVTYQPWRYPQLTGKTESEIEEFLNDATHWFIIEYDADKPDREGRKVPLKTIERFWEEFGTIIDRNQLDFEWIYLPYGLASDYNAKRFKGVELIYGPGQSRVLVDHTEVLRETLRRNLREAVPDVITRIIRFWQRHYQIRPYSFKVDRRSTRDQKLPIQC